MGTTLDPLAIDLSYANHSPQNSLEITDVEQQALELTQCQDQDLQFESADLKYKKKCLGILEKTSKEDFTPAQFGNWRQKIIRANLDRHGEALLEKWPNIDFSILTKIIDKSTTGVPHISETVPRLIQAMLAHDLNDKGSYLVALIWTNIFALKQNHSRWLSEGHRPLLPDGNFEIFVEQALKKIESAEISIGLLRQDVTFNSDSDDISALMATYDYSHKRINFPMDYFKDPLAPFSDQAFVPFYVIIGHEMYHDYQFATGGSESLFIQSEYDAEVLSAKLYFMMTGFKNASLNDYRRDYAARNTYTDIVQDNFSKGNRATTPLNLVFNSRNELRDYEFRPLVYQIAKDELRKGASDPKKVEMTKRRYAIFQLDTMIFNKMQYIVASYKAERENFGDEIYIKLMSEKWEAVQPMIPKLEAQEVTSGDEFYRYIENIIQLCYARYYVEGPEKTQEYYDEHAFPLIVNKVLPFVIQKIDVEHIMKY